MAEQTKDNNGNIVWRVDSDGNAVMPSSSADFAAYNAWNAARNSGNVKQEDKSATIERTAYEEPPVFVDNKGREVSHMDLLRASLQIDKRRAAIEAGEVEAPEPKPVPQVRPEGWEGKDTDLTHDPNAHSPGERPVQPIGSTHDAVGRALTVEQPRGTAAWTPNAPVVQPVTEDLDDPALSEEDRARLAASLKKPAASMAEPNDPWAGAKPPGQ